MCIPRDMGPRGPPKGGGLYHNYTGPFLSHSLVEVTVPAEETSQEVKHTKVDATTNTGGVMKLLG